VTRFKSVNGSQYFPRVPVQRQSLQVERHHESPSAKPHPPGVGDAQDHKGLGDTRHQAGERERPLETREHSSHGPVENVRKKVILIFEHIQHRSSSKNKKLFGNYFIFGE